MIYNDGFKMNNSGRVIVCPKCGNEEFQKNTDFCRICGTMVYNKCEGEWDSTNEMLITHNNPGNARYCETCGKPTYFYEQKLLSPWTEYIGEEAQCCMEPLSDDDMFTEVAAGEGEDGLPFR